MNIVDIIGIIALMIFICLGIAFIITEFIIGSFK